MARRKAKTPMKFDFPDPFGPITTLIGLSSSFSTEAILLNPWTVIESSAFEDMRFLNHHTIPARHNHQPPPWGTRHKR
jgi:hypothetical protein